MFLAYLEKCFYKINIAQIGFATLLNLLKPSYNFTYDQV
jgi:hypothetical protein